MKKRRSWIKVKDDTLPPEKQGVHILLNYNDGTFNIFTGHIEQKVWFMYDPFSKSFRVIRGQHFVTHWMNFAKLPKIPARKKQKNIKLN